MTTLVRSSSIQWLDTSHTSSPAETQKEATAFRENMTISFYIWPIACNISVDTITAVVRGDNVLSSYLPNSSRPLNITLPSLGPSPTLPLVQNWAHFIDLVYYSGHYGDAAQQFLGQYAPFHWLEDRLMVHINRTTSTTEERIAAIEAELENITSVVYSLLFEQVYSSKNASQLGYSNTVLQGQYLAPLAKLQVHGLQVAVGFACAVVLLVCTLVATRGEPSGDVYMLSGNVIDLICLMKNSFLPEMLNVISSPHSQKDKRRLKAEQIDDLG